MKRSVLTVVATATVAVFGWGAPAQATPITYEISSVASGHIGAMAFNDAEVDLIGTGDTADATSFVAMGFTIFADPFNTFTATIAGIGTATITDPSVIWAFPMATPGFSPVPVVIIGREDVPHAVNSITGVGIVGSDALAGYEGTTAIGPITDLGGIGFPPCGTPGHDPCLATSLGFLSFTSNPFPPTGEGTFTATVNPVPEPGSLVLLGTGLLAAVSRFRRRRSTPHVS